ncbi:alpha/beta fold hydrolase [Actinomadura roseirufa]|uniref:alpha/beta fold hydrolase n=1 Tax=Actinomadura roseirufa TaxID=2094049 RepID=UPI001041A2ED|nr:alpha/beta fold hydrolase [Actinomadura roseirufa]
MWTAAPDGTRIAFEVAGHGRPVVLLHGFFGDRTTWRSSGHVDGLADRFRLVLIDARGHGRSDAPHEAAAYAAGGQAADVIAVMDALDVPEAAVWGASMGGIVGLHLAAAHPGRITRVVAGGAHAGPVATDPGEAAREARLLRAEGAAPFVAEMERRGRLPDWMRTVMLKGDPAALAALSLALADREGVEDVLARSGVPLLLLAGANDPRLPAIRRTAARVPGAVLAELPGCGHLDTFLRTDLTLPLARPFLSAGWERLAVRA